MNAQGHTLPRADGRTRGVHDGAVTHPVLIDTPIDAIDRLRDFVTRHSRLLVLTGAGVSTASGIPDYRDREGGWKRAPPMTLQQFMATPLARARYWARSMLGWPRFDRARPNAAHRALATLAQQGRIERLVTQNVDGLHQSAGSTEVIDLHGRLDRVRCMDCEARWPRADLQRWLEAANPAWCGLLAAEAPDGDADLEHADFARFEVPPCARCGGILKPDVVFFGETVPSERVAQARAALARADALLVVGSSLMVFSGYRFALLAHELGRPVAAINHGHNRADALLTLKVQADCGAALQSLLQTID